MVIDKGNHWGGRAKQQEGGLVPRNTLAVLRSHFIVDPQFSLPCRKSSFAHVHASRAAAPTRDVNFPE